MDRYQYQNECFDPRYNDQPSTSRWFGDSSYQDSTYFDRPRTHQPGRDRRPFRFGDKIYSGVIREPTRYVSIEEESYNNPVRLSGMSKVPGAKTTIVTDMDDDDGNPKLHSIKFCTRLFGSVLIFNLFKINKILKFSKVKL